MGNKNSNGKKKGDILQKLTDKRNKNKKNKNKCILLLYDII